MKRKQRTLVRILLIPLILVVLFQGFLTFATLYATGVKKEIEQNRSEIIGGITNSRRVLLENSMVDDWSSIRGETDTQIQ